MRKGFEWSISLLIAVVFLVFSVGIFWAQISGQKTTFNEEEMEEIKTETCNSDSDCPGNQKCIQIYPGDFTPFCGCITNSDCDGGICGPDNKCS